MDAGKLDTRVIVKRLTKTNDGYGGTTATKATQTTIWAYKVDVSGDIKTQNVQRKKFIDIELVVRKKTADDILDEDILQIEGNSTEYRINEKFDSEHKYFTTIRATKIG